MEIKTIVVPNRDVAGWLHGTKTVTVEWNCPKCGNEMGEPQMQRFCEDGEWYSVHTWENSCGYIAKYEDLKEERVQQETDEWTEEDYLFEKEQQEMIVKAEEENWRVANNMY